MSLCGGKHAHPMVLADPQVVYRKYGGAWRCDGCGCTDSARVLVFHCAQCNYDLCSACFCFLEARHPAHPHPFRLACQRSPTAATAPRCSECRAPLACAQVCTVCRNPPYRVCPSCFNGFFGLLLLSSLVACSLTMGGVQWTGTSTAWSLPSATRRTPSTTGGGTATAAARAGAACRRCSTARSAATLTSAATAPSRASSRPPPRRTTTMTMTMVQMTMVIMTMMHCTQHEHTQHNTSQATVFLFLFIT